MARFLSCDQRDWQLGVLMLLPIAKSISNNM